TLDAHCDDNLPPVLGPMAAIEQVVLNLSVNAGDALPHGGTVRIEAVAREEHVRLQVSDDGIGMDEATCARVFDRFFTTKAAGKGTGLGLATVRDLTNRCGGNVTVKSAPGAGTTFEVCLPAHRELHTQRTASDAVILAMNDDPYVRDFVVSTLEHAGYSVVRAVDGADALRTIQARPEEIGLAVTSLSVRGCDSTALYHAMLAAAPALRLVICGRSRAAVAPTLLASPRTTFLADPWSSQELLAKVAAHLDAKE
ncbi:MAG TPA: ATP-binding protein, partial [Polyangiales bacterium]|nr:ATP-binding protein [Polyangiales bacterium]